MARFKFQAAFIALVWPVWAVGLYRGIHHAVGFIGYALARRTVGVVQPFRIFALRDIYLCLSHVVGVAWPGIGSPLLFASGNLFYGMGEVASDTLMQQQFTDGQRATMGSLSSTAGSLLFAIIAVALGMMSDRYGIVASTALGIGLRALSFPIYLILFRRRQ